MKAVSDAQFMCLGDLDDGDINLFGSVGGS